MKAILLYLVLVGAPLVGLLAMLRVGQTLEVPPSIGGAWVIDPTTAQAIKRSCAALDLPDQNPEMTISQSGRYVQVRFNDTAQTAMIGRLHANSLAVRQVSPCADHARHVCGETTMVLLQVQRQHSSGQADRLAGWWKTPECGVCPPQSFRSVRLAVH